MEYWEMEEIQKLEKELCEALSEKTPNFERARELLKQGVDINATDECGDSIFEHCLLSLSNFPRECDYCEDYDSCRTCEHKTKAHLLSVVEFLIENGLDTVRHGLNIAASLVHSTHDMQMFYAVKRIMECPLSDNQEEYELALESIGTEESYQRCCTNCHEEENLYYAMYELVDARLNGKPFSGIHPFYKAIGKRIDKIVYFSENTDFVKTDRGTEFDCDFGFVLGNEVLTVRSSVNILFMNDRMSEEPQIDVSGAFGKGIIGATVSDILFKHQSIVIGKTEYGQPTIILRLDSGKEISFTHNFGEEPDKPSKSRFLTTEDLNRSKSSIDRLVDMCSSSFIDLDKIESYITGMKISSDELTRAAIKLVEKYEFEVDSFRCENGRDPFDDELVSSNWLPLFRLFLQYGLDPNRVYWSDGSHENLLFKLTLLDNVNIVYKLLRLLFINGADPNIIIDDTSLFEMMDEDVVIYATHLEIEDEDRQSYEKGFRLWLLMLAFGGCLNSLRDVVKMKDGYDVTIFENCEAFSYRLEKTKGDWYLHIYITKTGEEVAVL